MEFYKQQKGGRQKNLNFKINKYLSKKTKHA